MSSTDEIASTMGANRAFVPGRTIKFDFGDEGVIFLDGVTETVTIANAPAETTIRMTLDNFKALAQGKLNPTMAFMTGKIQIQGDMGLAMQLQSVTSKLDL